MFDFSVYVTIINKTNERLLRKEISVQHGEWINAPDAISANSTSKFQLKDLFGSVGSEGSFKFSVETGSSLTSYLSAYQKCPTFEDNYVRLDPIEPRALYNVHFRTKVDDQDWENDKVKPGGHPFQVEYTIEYQTSKPYLFRVLEIKSGSGHPVRNSNNQLIVGDHIIWNSDFPDSWKDGDKGSLQPSVIPYDFISPVQSSYLVVTLRPLDSALVGAECFIYGSVGGKMVLRSDFFFIESITDRRVFVHIVEPKTSKWPFVLNADVEWGLELKLSKFGVDCAVPRTSRVELYWIAKKLHQAFQSSGIPVGFLRDVLGKSSPFAPDASWYSEMTKRVFSGFNKIYDTISGSSSCGLRPWGGCFNEEYYRSPSKTGDIGTLHRHVNCMDQAAMLELVCSLAGGQSSASWLLQEPFGFIQTSKLVGVVDSQNKLIDVNNPFFGTDQDLAWLDDIDDPARWPFRCHVYVGQSNPFVPATDVIYDACGGPHIGDEDAAQFVAHSIDTKTKLYKKYPASGPGTIDNIQQGDGVTSINGPHRSLSSSAMAGTLRQAASKLVTTVDHDTNISYSKWPQLSDWLRAVLGESWNVLFEQISAGDGISHGFWHLGHTGEGEQNQIRINVYVHATVDANGALDPSRSSEAARDRLSDILISTDYDPDKMWTRGTLEGFGECLQYREDINVGRVAIIAGHVVVDIKGMSSTAALVAPVRKMLDHTLVKGHSSFALPIIKAGPIRSDVADIAKGSDTIVVKGLNSRFSFYFETENPIVVANATTEGSTILFDHYAVKKSPQGGNMVNFSFISRDLGGHTLKVHFMDARSMMSATKVVKVDVRAEDEA